MVRRGSTVRVRQRACKIPATLTGIFPSSVQDDLLFVALAVDMEAFMELSRTRVDLLRV
jgi:hypothetical protein